MSMGKTIGETTSSFACPRRSSGPCERGLSPASTSCARKALSFGLSGFLGIAGGFERVPGLLFQGEPLGRHREAALGVRLITACDLLAEASSSLDLDVV